MNKLRTCIVSSWLLLALAAQAQVKSSRELGHGSGVLESGVTLQYKTVMEPPKATRRRRGWAAASSALGGARCNIAYMTASLLSTSDTR